MCFFKSFFYCGVSYYYNCLILGWGWGKWEWKNGDGKIEEWGWGNGNRDREMGMRNGNKEMVWKNKNAWENANGVMGMWKWVLGNVDEGLGIVEKGGGDGEMEMRWREWDMMAWMRRWRHRNKNRECK